MRAREFLFEKALAKGDFGPEARKKSRLQQFISKIESGSPFQLTGGAGEVTIEATPQLIASLKSLIDYKALPTKYTTTDGRTVSLSQLEKTGEFGGTGSVATTDGGVEKAGKEAIPLKPAQIGITGTTAKFNPDQPNALKLALETGAFPAGELGEKILNNPILKEEAGPAGQAVIKMAYQIMGGQVPDMPSAKNSPLTAQSLKAIRDYAGEYLGILQVVEGTANWDNVQQFYEFMETDQAGIKDLILYFPKSTNTPLADSLALQNSETGHVIKLSSKGGTKGAPPSLDNLKIPPELETSKNKKISQVVRFLKLAQSSKADYQPFALIDFLIRYFPNSVPQNIQDMFPISPDEFNKLLATHENPQLPYPPKFVPLVGITGAKTGKELSGSPFGKVHYQLNKIVINAINKQNVMPAFRSVVLEILGFNFVQVFSRERSGKLYADVLWPAKVKGNVEIYSKASSADPKGGKLSFSVTD